MWNISKFLFSIVVLIGLNYQVSQAQILNADRLGSKVDSSNTFRGVFDFGMSMKKQTDLIISFNTKLDLSYWFKRNVLMLVGKFNLFRTGSDNLINGGYGHLRLRILHDHWIHPEVFAQYQQDGVRGMETRILAGANTRYKVVEYDKGHVHLGFGAMYEYERWNYTGVPSTITIIDDTPIGNHYIKLNLYASYLQNIGKVMDIQTIMYVQSRPDSQIIYPRISGNIALGFKITKHIRISMRYSMFYDAAPPVPVPNLNFSMINKISFIW
ncbi:MAG: DUF481 domain-containing protein [Aureispira sp.]|nr:DUF481 domain-containing protein [Aureispira sp.]